MPNHNSDPDRPLEPRLEIAGLPRLIDWIRRVLVCWHRELSWPFTIDGETYRVCLNCGARRRFIAESWQTVGGFYHNSTSLTLKQKLRRRRSELVESRDAEGPVSFSISVVRSNGLS
jgi:hypothetical protein